MLNKKMEAALNGQINEELFSSYLYLSMSAHFESLNLRGFANWMRVQAQEELVHAIKIYDYIIAKGGRAALKTVKGPETEWKSPLAMFQAALKHEEHITGCINDLSTLALDLKDHASAIMLQWFVTEQVEEEANATEIIQKLKLMQDAPGGLFLLNNELAQRVFTMPAGAGPQAGA